MTNMSASYPHDYHPLAPIVRKLRGSLQWLDESAVHIEAESLKPLLQRISSLNQAKQSNTQRVVRRAQYWSMLPYSRVLTGVDEHVLDNVSETLDNVSETLYHKGSDDPLPVSDFPAIAHQRSLVESISFDQPPPKGVEVEGSIELMSPSQTLKVHRGLIIIGDGNSSPEPLQTSDNSFLTAEESERSTLTMDLSSAKPQRDKLWATQSEDAQSSEKPLSPQASMARGQAFERLKATQKKNYVETPLQNSLETLNAENKRSLLKLKSDGSRSKTVRPIGFEEDERFGALCDRVWGCDLCPRNSATHLVGSGHYGAKVMFVVGQPSEHDLITGQLLMNVSERELFNGLLKAMSLSRLEIYLTSLLKCGSDEPKPHEWSTCQQHFLDELQIVRPQVIIALGYVASVILLGPGVRQGGWGSFQEIEVMPTFHPADIVNGGDTLKRQFWRHLRDVMRKAELKP